MLLSVTQFGYWREDYHSLSWGSMTLFKMSFGSNLSEYLTEIRDRNSDNLVATIYMYGVVVIFFFVASLSLAIVSEQYESIVMKA